MFRAALESRLGVVEQPNAGVAFREAPDQFRRRVFRFAVDHQDFESAGSVLLRDQLAERGQDVGRLVPNRHDNRDEEPNRRRLCAGRRSFWCRLPKAL